MGFGPLRVINDDTVAPGEGFGEHPHRDMEILTYVLSGALEHKDSSGGGGVIRPGDVQRMSAGSGVVHSEYNASASEPVHFLQIWLVPDTRGIAPRYGQTAFPAPQGLQLIASKGGRDGSLDIQQDANVYRAIVDGALTIPSERNGWLHVARGSVELNGTKLQAGDGVAIENERSLQLANGRAAEILYFDLP